MDVPLAADAAPGPWWLQIVLGFFVLAASIVAAFATVRVERIKRQPTPPTHAVTPAPTGPVQQADAAMDIVARLVDDLRADKAELESEVDGLESEVDEWRKRAEAAEDALDEARREGRVT